MKKKFAFILVSVLAVSSLVQSQSLEDVLKKHFAAIGQEKLLTVNTIKVTGKMVQGGTEIPLIQMLKRPDFVRVEGTFQDLTFVQTYNGKEGWSLNPFAGSTTPQPFTDDQIKSVRYQADMDGMLWNWKEKGYTVTLEGKEDMEGTSCFKVKLVTKESDSFTYYLDSDSYIMLRTNSNIKIQGNDSESDSYYSNYMQVEGIAIPGKVDVKMNGQLIQTIITDKVDVNIELDNSLFEKPATK
jgi:hypothetical protein